MGVTIISTDFEPVNCTDLEIGGIEGVMYGINYTDWVQNAVITRDPLTGAISAVTLTKIGIRAVKYAVTRGGNPTEVSLALNSGGKSGFMHKVSVFLPTKDATIRQEIVTKLNFGRMVWIVVLDSSIVAQVFGNDVGLALAEVTEANADPSKGGGFDAIFSTPDNVTSENLMPVEFKDTDRPTTIAALEALLIEVTA